MLVLICGVVVARCDTVAIFVRCQYCWEHCRMSTNIMSLHDGDNSSLDINYDNACLLVTTLLLLMMMLVLLYKSDIDCINNGLVETHF